MTPPDTRFDVLTVGHPLVDVISRVDEKWLVSHGLVKGERRLIDADEAVKLYDQMPDPSETAGGCASNTSTGVLACGASVGFAGTLAADALGSTLKSDLEAMGIEPLIQVFDEPPTGRCLIFVTPDGDRTMNTCVGAGIRTSLDLVAKDARSMASLVYGEAYLLDNPGSTIDAWVEGAKRIHDSGGRLALSLSDPHCVVRHRTTIKYLLYEGLVDICIGNDAEAMALFESDSLEDASKQFSDLCSVVAITCGPRGAVVLGEGHMWSHKAAVVDVVDTTGAGDLYSGGFLAGLSQDMSLDEAGRLGIECAGRVVERIGGRLPVGTRVELP